MLSASHYTSGFSMGYAGFQAGPVIDVVAVTFSEGNTHYASDISPARNVSRADLGAYSDPRDPDLSKPLSARAMRGEMLQALSAHLNKELTGVEVKLRGAYSAHTGETLAEDANIGAMLENGEFDDLPPELRKGFVAYGKALNSAKALVMAERLDDLAARSKEFSDNEDGFRALVRQAIADHVDAQLQVERIAKAAERERALSVLDLMDPDGDPEQRRMLREATDEMAILGKRKDMIRDMTRKVDRGDMVTSISHRTVWAHEGFSVDVADGHEAVVYASTRYHAAGAAVSISARGNAGAWNSHSA